MTKNTVCAILLSLACPALLNAAVTEEYNGIQVIEEEVSQNEVPVTETAKPAAAEPQIQNTIPTARPEPSMLASAGRSGGGEVLLETSQIKAASAPGATTLSPLLGGAQFQGPWSVNVRNQYTFGLALDIPVTKYFSFEIEGGYGNYRIAYTPNPNLLVAYSFNQFLLGGNAKVHLTSSQSLVRPFVGAGLSALYYEGMSRMMPDGSRAAHEHLLGAANLMVGVDVKLSESVSVGARGTYLMPLINRPFTANAVGASGLQAAAGYEETGFMNASMFRLLGSVSIAL
jgi:outer membrane protein W